MIEYPAMYEYPADWGLDIDIDIVIEYPAMSE